MLYGAVSTEEEEERAALPSVPVEPKLAALAKQAVHEKLAEDLRPVEAHTKQAAGGQPDAFEGRIIVDSEALARLHERFMSPTSQPQCLQEMQMVEKGLAHAPGHPLHEQALELIREMFSR